MSTQTTSDTQDTMTHEDVMEQLQHFISALDNIPELQSAARDIYEFAQLVDAHQEPSGTVHITPNISNAGLYTRGFLRVGDLADRANAMREYNLAAFMTSMMRLAIFFDYPIPFNLKRQRQDNASGSIRPQYNPHDKLETA